MSNIKIYKKGEFLFKENDKVNSILVLQSGTISLHLARTKKNIELGVVSGNNQVLGEGVLWGAPQHTFSAMATSEVKILELPLEVLKAPMEGLPQAIKIIMKSQADKLKSAISDVRSLRAEKDNTPCPDDQVAKVFGVIFHTANHKGEKDEKRRNQSTIDWTLMKQYAQRVFSESPRRLEQAVYLLVKLKIASLEMGKPVDNPEGPDEIQKVHFLDLASIEAMFEFYQYYYFKGGRTDLLKYEELPFTVLSHFLSMSEGLVTDRFGAVSLEYSKVLDSFKTNLNINLNNTHFDQLEKKGIFFKRATRTDGAVMISFEVKEFKTTQKIWLMIKEIDKWNEKGYVDMHEEEKPKRKPGVPSCPQCSAEIAPQSKFCSECGTKIANEKAA